MEEGKIKAVIDRVYPLAQTGDAVKTLRQGHACGKVVISMEQVR